MKEKFEKSRMHRGKMKKHSEKRKKDKQFFGVVFGQLI